MDQTIKKDAGKQDYSLIPLRAYELLHAGGVYAAKFEETRKKHNLSFNQALEAVRQVMQWAIDCKGYLPNSWLQVEPERYMSALIRHEVGGLDDESGLPHYYHALTNILFLCYLRGQK